jgi:hypothetical protein
MPGATENKWPQEGVNGSMNACSASLLDLLCRQYDFLSGADDRDRLAMINCLKSRIVLVVAVAAITQVAVPAPSLAQRETPTEIIASQLRRQGFPCTSPQPAVQDRKDSSPNAAVWRLQCAEATYRITLVPNLAARVERIQDRQDEK